MFIKTFSQTKTKDPEQTNEWESTKKKKKTTINKRKKERKKTNKNQSSSKKKIEGLTFIIY
jgi:hypothetical protein